MSTHEIECEASHDSHVFGTVAGSVTRKVVFERDIKQPMHAFDPPMASCGVGEALYVERRRGDVETRVKAAAIGKFGARVDLEHGLDVAKAGLAWVAAIGRDPVDLVGGGVDAGLDAAVPLLNGRFGDKLGGRSGAEITSTSVSSVGWLPLRASR